MTFIMFKVIRNNSVIIKSNTVEVGVEFELEPRCRSHLELANL